MFAILAGENNLTDTTWGSVPCLQEPATSPHPELHEPRLEAAAE
jgi:hypothetical protein